MRYLAESVIPANHPSLPGHFPGQPIVPGVVILDAVLHALYQWRPESRVAAFRMVKFVSPLLPDEMFTIELEQENAERPLRFTCRVADRHLVQGQLALQPVSGAA